MRATPRWPSSGERIRSRRCCWRARHGRPAIRIPPASASVAWAGILALAFISQLFGNTILVASVRRLSVTFVATTILLEPLIAAIAAAFVFGERPAPLTALGALLILAAIGLAIRAEPAPASGVN